MVSGSLETQYDHLGVSGDTRMVSDMLYEHRTTGNSNSARYSWRCGIGVLPTL